MRRAVLALALVLVAVPTAAAQLERYVDAGGGTLSLRDGKGVAHVVGRGGILGSVARGRVRIRDLPDRAGTKISVSGAEWSRVIDARTTVYGGRDLRFRALEGAWAVRIAGRGIDASAGGRGRVTLKGSAGTFSVDGDDYRRWPEDRTTFRYGD